jgi:hypothetical protein
MCALAVEERQEHEKIVGNVYGHIGQKDIVEYESRANYITVFRQQLYAPLPRPK